MEKRKIYILLTKLPGKRSSVIRFATRSYYAHASIGLEEDTDTFYSFVIKKGFIVEKLTRYIKPDRAPFPCQLYELEVTEDVYMKVKSIIRHYIEIKDRLHYSKLGLFLSILHIPYKRNQLGFFCTQFVAEVLKSAGAVMLTHKPSHYFSKHLKLLPGMKLNYQGNLKTLIEHFKLKAVQTQS
ncbi:MAG: hypothetical protein IJC83_03455 [Oscillospiraceae bacterium]|nr:hypothetical protein [Oscillospiraceae bacterium]